MRRLRTAIRMVGMVGLLAALVLADGSAVANQHGDSETAREQEPDADSTDEPESLDASRAREPVDDSRASEPDDAPVFVPPNRGAPRRLVGAATRGGEPGEAAGVAALVPQATGYTLRARPVLYWYAFERMAGPCELTLVADGAERPLLETRISGPFRPGVRAIRLADHGVELTPGVTYGWYLVTTLKNGQPPRNRMIGGAIRRISPDAALRSALAASEPERRAHALAAAGIWYDALHSLSERIDAAPKTATRLRVQRAELLGQVGLTAVATRERAAAAAQRGR